MTRVPLLARRAATSAALSLVFLVAVATVAGAHPLGNFTTNTYAGVVVSEAGVVIDYVLDLAEIPTVQARQRIDSNSDDQISPAEASEFSERRCAELAGGVKLTVADQAVMLEVAANDLSFPPGEAGLKTTRLECRLVASGEPPADEFSIAVEDTNAADRLGWREITATTQGMSLVASDVPSRSISDQLRAYPEDRLRSPLEVRTASVTVAPGPGPTANSDGVAAADGPSGIGIGAGIGLTNRLMALFAERELTLAFGLLAVLAAAVLGASHAVAPGHGKTVMAAYAVGQRGSLRQILLIGLTVAATHTIGVLLLGLTISVSDAFLPAELYPWFGLVSGALIVAIGVGLLRRSRHAHPAVETDVAADRTAPALVGAASVSRPQVRSRAAVSPDHRAHGHVHTHGGVAHSHAPLTSQMRRRDLVTLGLAGGLVPSPSALLVLLGAVALDRAWFGVVLVTTYGLGLAATLVSAGLLLVSARGRVERWTTQLSRPRWQRLTAALPTVTAVLVIAGGTFIAVRSFL